MGHMTYLNFIFFKEKIIFEIKWLQLLKKHPKKLKEYQKKAKKVGGRMLTLKKWKYLEDKRLEERLGGAFVDRPDEQLFTIDKDAQEFDEKPRKKWKKNRENKPLKCFQHLEIKSGVADPKKGRNTRKTPEERRNPTLVKKEKEMT